MNQDPPEFLIRSDERPVPELPPDYVPRHKRRWEVVLRFRDLYFFTLSIYLIALAAMIIANPNEKTTVGDVAVGFILLGVSPFVGAGSWFLCAAFVAVLGKYVFDPALRFMGWKAT